MKKQELINKLQKRLDNCRELKQKNIKITSEPNDVAALSLMADKYYQGKIEVLEQVIKQLNELEC